MRDGLVVVDKPAGCTSHDVVARLRRVYGQRRVGHAGTLDPDATGVLLVGLGRATRLLRYLSEAGKAYEGRIVFGIATSTLDAAGEIVDQRPMPLTRRDVERALPRFVGDIEQLPPMVSAVKVGGRRLHELARAGQEVERAPRPWPVRARWWVPTARSWPSTTRAARRCAPRWSWPWRHDGRAHRRRPREPVRRARGRTGCRRHHRGVRRRASRSPRGAAPRAR